jgi:hypothetical protein
MSITIPRRRAALSIRMNASISLKPSGSETGNEQTVRHSLLEILEHAGFSSGHADRQRLTVRDLKLDDVVLAQRERANGG